MKNTSSNSHLLIWSRILIFTGMVLILFSLDHVPGLWASSLSEAGSRGVVRSVVKAPIVPDGNVAGAPTDLVVNLAISLDPAVTGRTLLKGNTIKVTLPKAFKNKATLPTKTIFSSNDCMPGNVQCNTGVLLQGWPQHPILPLVPPKPPGSGKWQYTVSLEGTHTIVFTANIDLGPGVAASGPGIKQIHLILPSFVNPAPGLYDIQVAAETGPDGIIETGTGRVQIFKKTQSSLNVVSAYNSGSPNTMYQSTSTNSATPFSFDFLMWDNHGQPFTGVTITPISPTQWSLVKGPREVGKVWLQAPEGSTQHRLVVEKPSFPIKSPVLGIPTARLTAQFITGSQPGDYVLTFKLNEGNSTQMFVKAH